MPVLKKKPKQAESEFEVGQAVQFDNEGTTVLCEVTKLNKDGTIEVKDGNDNLYDIESGDLEAQPEKPAKSAKPAVKGKPAKPAAKGKGSSLAEAFNEAKAASKGGGLPDGKYEALVSAFAINKNEHGTFGEFTATVVNSEGAEYDGTEIRLGYMLLDSDEDVATGMEYFKRDLAMLGLDVDSFEDDADMENQCDELADGNPWISLNAKENKQGYTNYYLNGLMEDQDDKPEMPTA